MAKRSIRVAQRSGRMTLRLMSYTTTSRPIDPGIHLRKKEDGSVDLYNPVLQEERVLQFAPIHNLYQDSLAMVDSEVFRIEVRSPDLWPLFQIGHLYYMDLTPAD